MTTKNQSRAILRHFYLVKDYEFWQSDWNTNVTGKIPFKTNAAVSWRNPRLDSSLTEPLAYIVSNASMYKFNYWSIPISQEALDIRYFLFDCVQANYKPHNSLFLGPSYKQAFIADDVYSRESKSLRQGPSSYVARLIANNHDTNKSVTSVVQDESKLLIRKLTQNNHGSTLQSASLLRYYVSVMLIVTTFLMNLIF